MCCVFILNDNLLEDLFIISENTKLTSYMSFLLSHSNSVIDVGIAHWLIDIG